MKLCMCASAQCEQRRPKKQQIWGKSLHFPACPGARHACDVTISIYTATGKNFFLHCYIVTTGAGAEPGGRKRRSLSLSRSIYNILTPNHQKKKPDPRQSEKTSEVERKPAEPNRTRPAEKERDKTSTDVSGFLSIASSWWRLPAGR